MRRRSAIIDMQRRMLLDPPPTAFAAELARRVRLLERVVAAQAERIAALEAQRRPPEPLQRVNDSRRAEAHRLREAIAAVLAEHSEPRELTAKAVGRALERAGFDRIPPERTLRRHLTAVRAATAIQ